MLDWPGNSPDVNPTDNVWQYVKREISKTATTKQKFIEKLNDVWHRYARLQNFEEIEDNKAQWRGCSINFGDPTE
ncbi:hypothetical protein CDAR_300271 [Caerostris darwini]|uniref:Tc1-like transposase DDE domain-containing protein n=1 Tax=Caerostris darwini TaxID=1538125 RepID=A0AAV4VM40_9ARAC|nr:hypothetical protein CDAR_300271 [Caerostris darwini]